MVLRHYLCFFNSLFMTVVLMFAFQFHSAHFVRKMVRLPPRSFLTVYLKQLMELTISSVHNSDR